MKVKTKKIITSDKISELIAVAVALILVVVGIGYLSQQMDEKMKFFISFMVGVIFILSVILIFFSEEKVVQREPVVEDRIKVVHIEKIKEPTEFGSRDMILILYLLEETLFVTYRKPESSELSGMGKITEGEYYITTDNWDRVRWLKKN